MGECSFFGFFGGIVQLSLAVFCLSSLISILETVKRYQENTKRSWLVFSLVLHIEDASKQGFSSLLAHVMNIMVSIVFSERQQENPCVWYFINLIFDTTLGVLLSYLILKSVEALCRRYKIYSLISGNYFNESDEKIDLAAWAIELMAWGTIVAIVRCIEAKSILIIGIAEVSDELGMIGKDVLEPLEEYPRLELVIVMVFVPLVMNVFEIWVQDNFLKGKEKFKEECLKETEEALESGNI